MIHTTAQKGAKRPKKFKGDPWPSVATALDALQNEDRERLAEANKAFMAMFESVPEEEFKADMAEHLAELAAGAEETAPQRRALEESAAATAPSGPGPLAAVFSHQGAD